MKFNSILYLEEINFVSTVVTIEGMNKIYSIRNEINNIAKAYFFSIKEYRKLIRKVLLLKNKIPIYFSNTLLLFYIKSKSALYWINYFMILKVCYNQNIIVFFKDGSFIELEISRKIFSREIKKINIV